MLAYVAGSVSTDLNVWERMACPCVSQAVCHSATTASVVWLLALDFTFTRCVSPCPWNFNIGCCANEKPLRLIAHRRVRFFTFMFVSTLVLGEGGNSLNPIQASENIMILETNDCTSSVSTWYRKNGVWSLILAWWRTKRVSCFAGWRMELYADIHLGCASICRRVGRHIHWEIFFLAPRHFFWVWTVCVSFDGSHFFSFKFWEAASIVSLGEAKKGFIFEIKFWLRVWSQSFVFFGVCGK